MHLSQVGDARQNGAGPVARDQQGARQLARPGGIDLVAQPLGEAVGEGPVLGAGESGALERGLDLLGPPRLRREARWRLPRCQ